MKKYLFLFLTIILSFDLWQTVALANTGAKTNVSSGKRTLTITSDSQEVQQNSGNLKSVFLGNVKVVYDDVTLNGGRVVLEVKDGKRVITAYGTPVTIVSPSRSFKLQANTVTFNLDTSIITAGNAKVVYNGNSLDSSQITYNVKTNYILANGAKNKQVTTIITDLP